MYSSKKYLVTELFGNLMSDDYEFECKDINECKKLYLKERGFKGKKIVYDSKVNHFMYDSTLYICIQEGHRDGDTKYIRGKRYFYIVVDN